MLLGYYLIPGKLLLVLIIEEEIRAKVVNLMSVIPKQFGEHAQ